MALSDGSEGAGGDGGRDVGGDGVGAADGSVSWHTSRWEIGGRRVGVGGHAGGRNGRWRLCGGDSAGSASTSTSCSVSDPLKRSRWSDNSVRSRRRCDARNGSRAEIGLVYSTM